MSSGPFTKSKYETASGDVYGIRVQPETLTAVIAGVTNSATAAAVDQPVFARVSGDRRGYGMFARRAYLKVTAAGDSGYAVGSVLTIPMLRQAVQDAITPTSTATYNGATCDVIGYQPEKRR